MAVIQDLLQGKDDKINYQELLKTYPWIAQSNKNCVLSPDSDGLLCGLFMSKVKKWKVVGFYDDKVSVINRKYINNDDLVFLDGEIFRENAKSMGHHMVCLNNKKKDLLKKNFKNCIQPNLIREYDGKHYFRLKYPLATIHMLVSIIAYENKDTENKITLDENAISPLFFTDGVFNVLFSYPENVLNWFKYLRIDEEWNPLKKVFENNKSVYETMQMMDEFFRLRDKISCGKERGDRLKISEKNGNPFNIEEIDPQNYKINDDAVSRIVQFCKLIGEKTSWNYNNDDWQCWTNLQYYKFTKGSFKGDNKTLTIKSFEDFIINTNPLSWAQTSGQDIEYTKESPSIFDFLHDS